MHVNKSQFTPTNRSQLYNRYNAKHRTLPQVKAGYSPKFVSYT